MKRIAVLGSTGSIGTSCLEVAQAHAERVSVFGITAHRNWKMLAEQAHRFHVSVAIITDASLENVVDRTLFPEETDVRFGAAAAGELAAHPDVNVVIVGIVGAAGLRSTWSALEQGKTVGIANKETLVVGGPLILALAQQTQACLIPVDSEHSAVFQAMQAGRREDLQRIILTASGGPFRSIPLEALARVTPEQALAHPTWNMGPKITIDSATMMNKALEVIEARWLFGVTADQIDVVVHPQSIVHSLVEFRDGSVVAQMSPPDMKMPIQLALSYPERWEATSPRLDWKEPFSLDFEPPDRNRFPALDLGFEVARRGGTSGAVLNAANEIAVERFLEGSLAFQDIVPACRSVLDSHDYDPSPTLDQLFELDAWAREETLRWKHS